MDRDTALTQFADAAAKLNRSEAIAAVAQEALDALYEGRVWQAAGYDSWPAACLAQFGVVPKMWTGRGHNALRRKVAREMRGEGMTEKAIADALGELQRTIHNDVADVQVSNVAHLHDGGDRVRDKRGRRARRKRTDHAVMLEMVRNYLEQNPDATHTRMRKDLDIGNGTASKYANELGHIWPKHRREPKPPTPKQPKPKPAKKPTAPPNRDEKPPPDLRILGQITGITGTLAERNARKQLAAYVTEKGATTPHKEWLATIAADLDQAAAYFADMHRIITDPTYTQHMLNPDVGRDDIPEQQVKPTLRSVSA